MSIPALVLEWLELKAEVTYQKVKRHDCPETEEDRRDWERCIAEWNGAYHAYLEIRDQLKGLDS